MILVDLRFLRLIPEEDRIDGVPLGVEGVNLVGL